MVERKPTAAQPFSWLTSGIYVGGFIPLLVLVLRASRGLLDANWKAEILNQFGMLALVFLIASLACTPLRLTLGWTWPLRIRRTLGVYSFFYAMLHVTVYAGLDKQYSLSAIIEDITQRNFILFGFLAFVLLFPLAATSTNAMIKALGAKRWQRLHRLAYVAGILAVIHFFYRVKLDTTEPVIYISVLITLLLVRVLFAIAARRKAAGAAMQ
jgi:methionine sulfoxide reductase heme-binding subunit